MWDKHPDLTLLSPISQPPWKPEGKEPVEQVQHRSEKRCAGDRRKTKRVVSLETEGQMERKSGKSQ